MNTILSISIIMTALAFSIAIPINAYAVDYTNFFAGADSQENNSGETGLRTIIEIESGTGDHDFDWSGDENHNYFIELRDSSSKIHHVGYFVDKDDDNTAYFFAEVFSGATKVLDYEGTSAVSSDGTNQMFAMHRSGSSWSYYDGTGFGDVQAQYTGGGSSFNANSAYALFEKGCAGGCTVDEMGDIVNVKFHTVMEHTSSYYTNSGAWSDINEGNMYYFATDNTGTNSDATNGGAETVVCGEMTAEGNIQDSGLSDNVMMVINEASPTCTVYTADLWN